MFESWNPKDFVAALAFCASIISIMIALDTRRRVAAQTLLSDFYKRADAINQLFCTLEVEGPIATQAPPAVTNKLQYQKKVVLLLNHLNMLYQGYLFRDTLGERQRNVFKRWAMTVIGGWASRDDEICRALGDIKRTSDIFDEAFLREWVPTVAGKPYERDTI